MSECQSPSIALSLIYFSNVFQLLIFLFCFRNVVYNLTFSDLNEQQRLTWYSNEHDAKMCVMKGKDDVSINVYDSF